MERKKILPYNPILKELARGLRANSTLSEVLLWEHLNGRQMLGYDFDRQKPIDNNGLKIVLTFSPSPDLPPQGGGTSYNPSPPEGEGKGEGDHLCLYYYETVNNFILDFFCSELMLAIEIDGDTHNYKAARDDERQRRLEVFGIRFLRFADRDVKRNMEGVISVNENWIKEKTHPCTPPKRGLK